MKPLKHWQDPVNALVGACLIISPWALGFQSAAAAMLNATLVGLVLVAAALGAILVPRAWEEWTEFALGLWLLASPWVLGFAHLSDARLGAVIAGVVVTVLSLWTLVTDKDYSHWWRDRLAH